jgi:beta-N-acetylglucosaminidase
MSRSQSSIVSWDEISTEGVKLSNTALDQWHVLVDQAKLSTADDATREEKFVALQNIVQSNPQQYQFLGENYFTLLDGEIKTMQTELMTLSKGSAALAPHVKQFSQIAQAVSIFAGLVSPKAAQGLDKVATGGFLLHLSKRLLHLEQVSSQRLEQAS